MSRLTVLKTYKIFIGGAFERSESGRYFETASGNMCRASRKDFRNAMTAARGAVGGWSAKSGYNRGQILYRIAEMLEARKAQFIQERITEGATSAQAETEVHATIDRLVYYAGWCDKYTQVFSAVNPVASSHFNFSVPEPTGVVVAISPAASPLLSLIGMIAPIIASGNTCVVLLPESASGSTVTFAEILETSDVPGGVVNLLTGVRSELIPTFATHEHLRAISGVLGGEERKAIRFGAAESVKRVRLLKAEEPIDWFADKMQGAEEIRALIEFKTTWHPVGA
jgi:acyl-CoA reductase-like NAD-dependent aldehyde dehydrogenase